MKRPPSACQELFFVSITLITDNKMNNTHIRKHQTYRWRVGGGRVKWGRESKDQVLRTKKGWGAGGWKLG